MVYLISVILFAVLLVWTWNNSRDFNNNAQKIGYLIIGIFITLGVTYIFFKISKIKINYQNEEIMKQIKKVILLIFTPINGLLSLPHFAIIIGNILSEKYNKAKLKRKIFIIFFFLIIVTIFEIHYLNNFQNGIIEMINQMKNK